MKIVIINGSPRINGATAKILHAIEEKLLNFETVDVEYINIGELKIDPCSGCCSCYKTGKCYMDDAAEMLSNKIALADGLVMGSPTYASNISGQLKQFIDRGHFVIEQLLHKKYAVSVATGENYGSKDTSKILNKLLQYSGASLSGKIICNLPFNGKPHNKALDKKLESISEKLYIDIKEQKNHMIQTITHKIIFSVGIKPFVKSKGTQYQGVVRRWGNIGIF
ncbi:MAG: flavodoxin family protein [Lachnospiraceae bacterium]|nr:flavodoxin family protein [Lachnospiraceae bacterium]